MVDLQITTFSCIKFQKIFLCYFEGTKNWIILRKSTMKLLSVFMLRQFYCCC